MWRRSRCNRKYDGKREEDHNWPRKYEDGRENIEICQNHTRHKEDWDKSENTKTKVKKSEPEIRDASEDMQRRHHWKKIRWGGNLKGTKSDDGSERHVVKSAQQKQASQRAATEENQQQKQTKSTPAPVKSRQSAWPRWLILTTCCPCVPSVKFLRWHECRSEPANAIVRPLFLRTVVRVKLAFLLLGVGYLW